MSGVVEAGMAYKEFSESVHSFSDVIRKETTGDDRSLEGFESELNAMLGPWDSEFKLKFQPPTAAEVIKSMLAWDLVDKFHGKTQEIDYYGSGFQRHFIYSLIQLGSQYVGKKPARETSDFTPSLHLVLFEEPEAFLHPPSQEILARNLKKLASLEQWQVVCATHSSHFVSKNAADIPSLVRLRRVEKEIKSFQIDDLTWNGIVDANQEINGIAEKYPRMRRELQKEDTKSEMEAIKNFLWLNPDRSSLFFANHVLLVEGPTEVALINRLVDAGKIQNSNCGLYILDCIGKYNIHRFMNLLTNLGVSHSVIHDDDNDRDEHKDINKLIEGSKDKNLTLCIKRIPDNLESMLALPSPGPNRRKPQHALYLYEKDCIHGEKIQDFCELVESCLPNHSLDA